MDKDQKSKFWPGLGIGLAVGIPVGRLVRNAAKESNGGSFVRSEDMQGVYAFRDCAIIGMEWGISAGKDKTIAFEESRTASIPFAGIHGRKSAELQ